MGWSYWDVVSLPRSVYRVLLDKCEEWADEARSGGPASAVADTYDFD